jgi:hypothetical protein
MKTVSFKFTIKEYFKLSTGATAFVGLMEPADYPIIIADKYIVEIKSNSGKCYKFSKISEDIFARSKPLTESKLRSLQTFENVDECLVGMNQNPIIICGYKK